ncbi:hypothetical protein WR25_07996 [Diploscapter pachys]|uniref:UDP-glucuronosyltransferase n=1 Tax=Diploscapter pachys TaxID=2018661 RepID=A0A2A2JPK7_9BILA|nr:hypothetical protein WR25_07996 [Diploscapter pachys]
MPIDSFKYKGKAKLITMRGISTRFVDDLEGADEYMLTHARLGFIERIYFEYSLTAMCQAVMDRQEDLEELRRMSFDVAFSEQVDLCGVGIIRYLGIMNHIWISTTPIMDAVSYNLGIPAPPSYVPAIEENDNSDVMGFWQRAFNLYMYVGSIIVHRIGTDRSTKAIQKYDPNFPNIRDIVANSSLCFVYSDEILDFARPILHKTIYIGGLGVQKPKPLDEKFSGIMSKGKKGVVIISLGSAVPFGSFPAAVIKGVVNVVKEMSDYHFVFKIANDDKKTVEHFEDVKNYDLVNWIPQSDILAHPRLKLFVTHGGNNGLIEAVLRAVPLVVVPVFADQFRNARMAEKRGIGKVLLKLELSEETFREAVKTVLEDER